MQPIRPSTSATCSASPSRPSRCTAARTPAWPWAISTDSKTTAGRRGREGTGARTGPREDRAQPGERGVRASRTACRLPRRHRDHGVRASSRAGDLRQELPRATRRDLSDAGEGTGHCWTRRTSCRSSTRTTTWQTRSTSGRIRRASCGARRCSAGRGVLPWTGREGPRKRQLPQGQCAAGSCAGLRPARREGKPSRCSPMSRDADRGVVHHELVPAASAPLSPSASRSSPSDS